MGIGEQSRSGNRAGWPVLLAGMVGGACGGSLALLIAALGDLGKFLSGLIAFCALVGIGTYLGQLAGSHLFRRPPDK
jgi:hypothetical protein